MASTMRALRFYGRGDIRMDFVPIPYASPIVMSTTILTVDIRL